MWIAWALVLAAAVFVVTDEDLRRSGVTSIPEALRLVPGLQVARIDANKWAISARGFNGRFANHLLVLIDGRSIYSPMFAGVFWDVQDTLLEDIERIEVIRGPGAALWGANAVNGVINIITRPAAQTQGALVSAGGGDEEQAFGALRYVAALAAPQIPSYYTLDARLGWRPRPVPGREACTDPGDRGRMPCPLPGWGDRGALDPKRLETGSKGGVDHCRSAGVRRAGGNDQLLSSRGQDPLRHQIRTPFRGRA